MCLYGSHQAIAVAWRPCYSSHIARWQFGLTQMPKKSRPRKTGRPVAPGRGTLVNLRCHRPFLEALDHWRANQEEKPMRPAAIVRLAEIGLATFRQIMPSSPQAAARASEMAAQQLDEMADVTADAEVQSLRKQRLLKGPREFRRLRKDRTKP
jgi:hypothetical protein